MSDRSEGLKPKYEVRRADGSEAGPCIVLEFEDPNSLPALRVWADTVRRDGYELLADDVLRRVEAYESTVPDSVSDYDTLDSIRLLQQAMLHLRRVRDRGYWLLRKLEWGQLYSYRTGWPCCPICGGIKPGRRYDRETDTYPANMGHKPDCYLNNVLIAMAKSER